MNSATSNSVTVTNFAYHLSIASNTLTPTEGFDFIITATIKGEDNRLFLGSANVALAESGGTTVLGTSSGTTSTGTLSLTISLNALGNKVIVATCATLTATVAITLVQAKLQIASINPIVIII